MPKWTHLGCRGGEINDGIILQYGDIIATFEAHSVEHQYEADGLFNSWLLAQAVVEHKGVRISGFAGQSYASALSMILAKDTDQTRLKYGLLCLYRTDDPEYTTPDSEIDRELNRLAYANPPGDHPKVDQPARGPRRLPGNPYHRLVLPLP